MMSFAQWGNALYSGRKSYRVVGHRKVFVTVASAVMAVSIVLMATLGFNPSIEFTGGSQFAVVGVADTANQQPAYDALASQGVTSEVRVSSLGTDSIRVQAPPLNPSATANVRQALAEAYGIDQADVQSTSIGPTWGADVTQKAVQSLVIFVVLVTVIMTVYFRSWTMSGAAMIALAHDMLLTVAVFAITRVEVSPATVIGFLTVLAYSLYDTVVVFDKVRELTRGVYDQRRFTFGELVNLAVNQTMVRSINTSVVAVMPVAAILFLGTWLLGSGTLTDISLALFVGMLAGTYSSIFVASPFLVVLEERRARTREHTASVLAARAAGADDGSRAGDGSPGAGAEVRVAPVVPGRHLGQAAQPVRRNRRSR